VPDDVQTVFLNNTFWGDRHDPRPKYFPTSIPRDLADRIIKLHGFPPAWWVAQFIKYIYKLRPEYQRLVEDGMNQMGFRRPIVGVHIRRTDKVTSREGLFHSVEEYFAHVADYYGELEMVQKVDKRRVYLATDDPAVILEAREKYPEYEILVNEDAAKVANFTQRYSEFSMRGLLLDVHMLSRTDHLICTFTSHICRLCYEHMQNFYPDAAHRFTSLEAVWFTHESPRARVETVIPDYPQYTSGFSAAVGDILKYPVWQNLSYSHYLVHNIRTNISDQIPIYKVKNIWNIQDFPTYPGV
jgi:glycoprotein 6-alpha-L-fucosyltransferase